MRRALVITMLLGIVSAARADRLALPQEQLEQYAPYIFVGEVIGVDILDVHVPDDGFSRSYRRGNRDRHFRYTIRVEEVEKSRGDLEPGQLVTVEAWRLLDRPGGIFATVTYQGHRPLPAKGDRVCAYLKGGRRTFKPLDPNGFAAVNGGRVGPPPRPEPAPQPQTSSAAGRQSALVPTLTGFALGAMATVLALRLRNRSLSPAPPPIREPRAHAAAPPSPSTPPR